MVVGVLNEHGGCDFQSATLTRLGPLSKVKNVYCLTTFSLIKMGDTFVFGDSFRVYK